MSSNSPRGAQTILPPGATIGILGGGQLGRMLALAGTRLGLNIHIYSTAADCPAACAASHVTVGTFDDVDAVLAFAKTCDAVTYEFENVPAMSAKAAATAAPLRPSARALDVSQDRLAEKTFLRAQIGLDVAGFEDVGSVYDLRRAAKRLGLPCVLKTRRFGYDGKGQVILKTLDDVEAAWAALSPLSLLAKFPLLRRGHWTGKSPPIRLLRMFMKITFSKRAPPLQIKMTAAPHIWRHKS